MSTRHFSPLPQVIAFATLLTVQPLFAQVTWNGGTSTSWQTGANWSSGSVPTALQIAEFSGTPTANQPNNGTSGQTAAGLSFVTSGWTISGSTLAIGGSGVSLAATSGSVSVVGIRATANQTWDINTGATLTAANLWSNDGSNRNTITKTGGGTMVISGNSTAFADIAAFNLNGGVLSVSTVTAIAQSGTGAVALNFNGGTLQLTGTSGTMALGRFTNFVVNSGGATFENGSGSSLNVNVPISGAGTLTKSGLGTVTLGTNNSHGGGTTISSGTLRAGHNSAFGSGTLTLGGGTVASDSDAARTITNAVSFTGDATFGQTSGGTGALAFSNASLGSSVRDLTVNVATTFEGAITNTGGINKLGNGTLTMAGSSANTYSGATKVSAGVLRLNKTGAEAVVGSIEVATGATLLVSASGQVSDTSSVTLSGGTIQRGAGVDEAFGTLNITSASTINFGSTEENRFLRFSTVTGGSNLTISNFRLDNRFIFAATDFAAGQTVANSFTFASSDPRQYSFNDGLFTITAIPEPSTVLAAFGLGALLLWNRRSRRSSKNEVSRCQGGHL